MAHVLYGNFDFENELSSTGYSRPARMERLNAELTSHLLAVANDGDHLFYACEPPAGFLESTAAAGFPRASSSGTASLPSRKWTCVPWGLSRPSILFARSMGWGTGGPEIAKVKTANSRHFSFEFEQRQQSGLPGQAVVSTITELVGAIRECASTWKTDVSRLTWLVKAEFGMSGRERITGTGCDFRTADRNWILRRLKAGERLFFEPRVRSLAELSTQWILSERALYSSSEEAVEFRGATGLLTDAAGQFLGCIPIREPVAGSSPTANDELSWLTPDIYGSVLQHGRLVADELLRLGYHGPAGIDSMVYRGPDGQAAIRTVQDVNARLTMGRIGLEWCRRFAPSGRPAWLLVPSEWLTDVEEMPSVESLSRRLTSPRELSGRPVKRVGVLFSEQADWTSFLATHLSPQIAAEHVNHFRQARFDKF